MAVSRASLAGLVALVLTVSVASQWWGARQQADLGQQVAALARPGDIRMLSSDVCAICITARQWLTQHAVPFQECSIERDAGCAAEFQALRAAGTPVILVRGQAELGFSPQRLLQRLQSSAG